MRKDKIPEPLLEEAVRKARDIETGIYEKKIEQEEKHIFSEEYQQKIRRLVSVGIETKKKTAGKKRIMDWAVGLDLLLNVILFVWYVINMMQMLQLDFTQFLENGFDESQFCSLGVALLLGNPFLLVYIIVFLITDIIYMILRLKRKEPYLTEKFSMVSLLLKPTLAVMLIYSMLIS